jgi:predicted TPR repeat methyltransferase
MPWSSSEGKDWILQRVREIQPSSVLDIGPGSGTYAKLLRPVLDPGVKFHALEIHEPYVERFGLLELYDRVEVADAREAKFPRLDVVILGDVLEHMTLTEAEDVWFKARAAAKLAVFLSIPIVEYPQDASEGNDHEAHVQTWSHPMVMGLLDGIKEFATFGEIGVYRA